MVPGAKPGLCNVPYAMAAQSCVPWSSSMLLSSLGSPSPQFSSRQSASLCCRLIPSDSVRWDHRLLSASSFMGLDKERLVRHSRRNRSSVFAEASSVTGRNEDASDEKRSEPRAKFAATRMEMYELEEVSKPLAEYMALPASQYSVLDAERIERVDDSVFKCYAHRFKFYDFEVGPVLLVRVEEQPCGCCIRLLSCTLEGSPVVVAQNQKFSATMVNRVSWRVSEKSPSARQLVSDTTLEVTVDIPFPFRALPVPAIEGSGSKVMAQLLKFMLPRFLSQLGKDYYAWASGDTSRKPVGTGEL